MDYKLLRTAVINSVLVLVYVTIVTSVMQTIERWGNPEDNFFGPVAFLMLFVLSAAVVGTLIFMRPVMIYLDGGKKEAVKLLSYTLLSLLILTAIVLIVVSAWPSYD